MTVVVADSSPLNYLVLIESIDLLHRLYGKILVPQEVVVELTDPAAPHKVKTWARALPGWVDVRFIPPGDDPALSHLDPGEQSAINGASELSIITVGVSFNHPDRAFT